MYKININQYLIYNHLKGNIKIPSKFFYIEKAEDVIHNDYKYMEVTNFEKIWIGYGMYYYHYDKHSIFKDGTCYSISCIQTHLTIKDSSEFLEFIINNKFIQNDGLIYAKDYVDEVTDFYKYIRIRPIEFITLLSETNRTIC